MQPLKADSVDEGFPGPSRQFQLSQALWNWNIPKGKFANHSQWASLVAQMVKNPPAMQKTWVRSLPWEKQLPTPVFWLGEFHGQRSLVDYSLVGDKESVTTE